MGIGGADPQRRARMVVGGVFGFIPAAVVGFAGASFGAAVVEPAVRALRAAKAAGHPGQASIGPIWHAWWAGRGYLPTHWGPVFAHPYLVLGALALAAGFGGLIAHAAGRPAAGHWGGPEAKGKGQFGSAHWRPQADLARSYVHWQAPKPPKPEPAQAAPEPASAPAQAERPARNRERNRERKRANPPAPASGLLVGADQLSRPAGGWLLSRDEHALILGSTRSGKTRRLIIPSVGVIGTAGQESLVLADPKGELYDHCAEWLGKQGYVVRRVDLIAPRPGGTARFNPLAAVWRALHPAPGPDGKPPAPDYAGAAKTARQVAHVITYGSPGSLGGTDPLWINGQISLTAACILLVADQARRVESANLAAVYRLIVSGGSIDEGRALDAVFAALDPDHPGALAYSTYLLAQGKTRASIIVTAAAGLQLWGDPEIAWATAVQDHDPADVGGGERPSAVFLVVPHDDASRYTAAGLYVSGLFRALTAAARDAGGRLPRRVNFLLDEFGNLPPFPEFDQFVTVSAGMGIRLVLALQNVEQLRKHYRETERTIRGNLGTWLFLRTSDLQTAKELGEMIGRYTLHSESVQAPKVGWLTNTSGVGHTSQGLSLTGRDLVTADELMRWPADTVLVWQAGFAPARLPLPDLSAWPAFEPLAERRPWTPPDTALPPVRAWSPFGPDDDGEDKQATKPAPQRPFAENGERGQQPEQKGETAMIAREELGPMAGMFDGQDAPLDPDDIPQAAS